MTQAPVTPFSVTDEEANEIAATLRRRHKDLRWSEDYLVGLLAGEASKMDIYWSIIGLRHCGSRRCLPALKTAVGHPTRDISATAIITIAHIARSGETSYYAKRLGDRQRVVRDYAMWAIGTYGDSRALDAVHAFIKRRRKSLSEVPTDCRVQLEIVAYFHRVLGSSTTAELLMGEYAFVRDALFESPTFNPFVQEQLRARAPGLQTALSECT